MTTQDKPAVGPLSAGDVKLLVKGDLVRGPDGRVHRFDEWGDGGFLTFIDNPHDGYLATLCAFIGRPGPDDWIKAPEGGWKENPVPGQMVDQKFVDGETLGELSDDCGWRDKSLIAFRLAPTAPVETLGETAQAALSAGKKLNGWVSGMLERAVSTQPDTGKVEAGGVDWHREGGLIYSLMQDGWRKGQPVMVNDVMIRVEACNRSETDIEPIIQTILAALRPQPSGETRERIAYLEAQVEEARSLIRIATDAAEDEGDRIYFGSSNHADWLREWAEKIEHLALITPADQAKGGEG